MIQYIAFDCETAPIVQVGKATTKQIPRLVCMSYYTEGMDAPVVVERARAVPVFLAWLEDPNVHLVGHNVAFDVLVMVRALTEELGRDFGKATFDLYGNRRVHDTITHVKLRRIEKVGTTKDYGYTLAFLAKRYAGIELGGKTGDDVWRMRYHELDGVRAEDYPARAYDYAAQDAVATWETWVAMTEKEHYTNESFQLCADLAFYLMSSWGFMVDQAHTRWIYNHYSREAMELTEILRRDGVMRDDGTNDTSVIQDLFVSAWKRVGRPPLMTDTGRAPSTANAALEGLKECGFFDLTDTADDVVTMRAYSRYKTTNKFIATYLDPLMDAGEYPVSARITTLVDTGRTSSSGPNIQNFPAHLNANERAAKAGGFEGPFGKDIRGCVVPRKGKVFLVADYSALELVTLAQVIHNIAGYETQLPQVINAGIDAHLFLLSHLWATDYKELEEAHIAGDEKVARWRQISKAANFAFGGGAYPDTFIDYVKGYGLTIGASEAHLAFDGYHRAFPDVKAHHFANIDRSEVRPGLYDVEGHGPNGSTRGWFRKRCVKKTAALNFVFQNLAASGAKYAAWNLQKTMYTDTASVLYGDRMVLFIHDEFVLEAEPENLEEKKAELSRIMVESMRLFTPNIIVKAEANILEERWSK